MKNAALFWIPVVLVGLGAAPLRADNLAGARYDAASDELVVTLMYRGTNPDYAFTTTWGACQTERGALTVLGEVLDSQAQDPARREFHETVNFDLSAIPCRPARVVLRTAPRYIGVRVPAAS